MSDSEVVYRLALHDQPLTEEKAREVAEECWKNMAELSSNEGKLVFVELEYRNEYGEKRTVSRGLGRA